MNPLFHGSWFMVHGSWFIASFLASAASLAT